MPPLLLFTRWSREGRKGQNPSSISPGHQVCCWWPGDGGRVWHSLLTAVPRKAGTNLSSRRRDSAAVSGQLESPLVGEKGSHKTSEAWLFLWGRSTAPPGPKHSQCLWNHRQIRPRHWNSKQGIITFKRLHESVPLPALYLRLG